MRFSRVVAKTNRDWINPISRRLAGQHLPLMLIEHVGRRSGNSYGTPVWPFARAFDS